jgi:molybdopterin synthase catalytic subunit
MPELTSQPLEPLLASALSGHDPEAGAAVLFVGTVRRHHAGREVACIEYSAHPTLAIQALHAIETEVMALSGISACRIWHRIGRLDLGEISVLILVSSVHRAEAYQGSRQAIEALKHRVPIWKHEHYSDGSSEFVQGCCLES